MKTSEGTLQGYNGVASVDKKHQAFGDGQEHHVLQPVLKGIQSSYHRLGISDDILQAGVVITADTGDANEANMAYLHNDDIDGYIPDNQFRSRDPRFLDQKTKYGKRHQEAKKSETRFPASAFDFNRLEKTCKCPAGEVMWLKSEGDDQHGHCKIFFEVRLSKCRACEDKHQCIEIEASLLQGVDATLQVSHGHGGIVGDDAADVTESQSGVTTITFAREVGG